MIRHGDNLFVLAADAQDPGMRTVLLRSLDHGATWQIQSMLPHGCNGLAAINNDLLVVGNGTVLRLVGAAVPPRSNDTR